MAASRWATKPPVAAVAAPEKVARKNIVCAACAGKHRAHVCGKGRGGASGPRDLSCEACQGRLVGHTCGRVQLVKKNGNGWVGKSARAAKAPAKAPAKRKAVATIKAEKRPAKPSTVLVNRPGDQGSLKSVRQKFTTELHVLAVKGDADHGRWQVGTSFHEGPEEKGPAPAAPRGPAAAPPAVVGEAIDVKFYSSGSKSFVVDKQSITRRQKSSGTFYEGKVLSYDPKTWEHTVRFKDGVKETYNLTDKAAGDYVAKGTSWRIAC